MKTSHCIKTVIPDLQCTVLVMWAIDTHSQRNLSLFMCLIRVLAHCGCSIRTWLSITIHPRPLSSCGHHCYPALDGGCICLVRWNTEYWGWAELNVCTLKVWSESDWFSLHPYWLIWDKKNGVSTTRGMSGWSLSLVANTLWTHTWCSYN